MKISKILLSSVAATAFAGAIASSAITAVSNALTRDSEIEFTDFGVLEEPQDTMAQVTLNGLPEDGYEVSVEQAPVDFQSGEFVVSVGDSWDNIMSGVIDDENYSNPINKDVFVKYYANLEGQKTLGYFLQVDTAVVSVELKVHCNGDLKYTNDFQVLGYNPAMTFETSANDLSYFANITYLDLSGSKKSFDENKDIITEQTHWFYKPRTDTIYFALAGYAGANYGKAVAKVDSIVFAGKEDKSQISCTIEKVPASESDLYPGYYTDTEIMNFCGEGGVSYQNYWAKKGFEGQLYRAIVTYKPTEGGHFVDSKIYIGDGIGLNEIVLKVQASDTQISADTESINFPQEGGVVSVEVSYTGFENPDNNGYQIAAYMKKGADSPFRPVFVDSHYGKFPETRSVYLEGSGKIILDVNCEAFDATAPTGVDEDVLVIKVNEDVIEIPVNRTKPSITLLNDDADYDKTKVKKITFGEEIDDVMKEVTFVVRNLINFYDVDDLEIETSNDAFQVHNVTRLHVKEADVDYGATITVLYRPFCDNQGAKGTLYIRNKETGETIAVALEGIAPVNAKGYTAVTGVAAEVETGAAYNVAGAAVGADAKGIVVKNGKKYNK